MADFSANPRRLLVFAPDERDASLARQQELLSGAEVGFSDRDLQVEYLTGDGASSFQRKYGVAADGFAALLVGRDGGVKHRYTEPIAPDELFSHIDAMPMRQREMRERDSD